MGNCLVSKSSDSKEKEEKYVTSSRTPNTSNRSSRMINMSDFMGIKKSDSIENFYTIEAVIGRGKLDQCVLIDLGAFGEVVRAKHLFSTDLRAIKCIEKKKLVKHSILMQL